MGDSLETRIALLEDKHKTLQEQATAMCERISSLEKTDSEQAVINKDISNKLDSIQALLQTKSNNFNLWVPFIIMGLLEIGLAIFSYLTT